MTTANWIAGLMRENYEAVGFIPEPTVEHQYIRQSRFVLQLDERGRRIGYLLYGALQQGKPVTITQHCIQYDKRNRGYGERAFMELLRRCQYAGVSSIALRCATDLEAVRFWQAQGFRVQRVVAGGQRRNRIIAEMVMCLSLPLLEAREER